MNDGRGVTGILFAAAKVISTAVKVLVVAVGSNVVTKTSKLVTMVVAKVVEVAAKVWLWLVADDNGYVDGNHHLCRDSHCVVSYNTSFFFL